MVHLVICCILVVEQGIILPTVVGERHQLPFLKQIRIQYFSMRFYNYRFFLVRSRAFNSPCCSANCLSISLVLRVRSASLEQINILLLSYVVTWQSFMLIINQFQIGI